MEPWSLGEGTTNLMQRLARLPTSLDVNAHQKPIPSSLSHQTPPLRNDLNQMVLHQPVETARLFWQFICRRSPKSAGRVSSASEELCD